MSTPTPFTRAKSGASSGTELDRFACCFLHTSKDGTIDWEAAAKDFDAKVKTASFKTVTLKALKRVQGDSAGRSESGAATTGGKGKVKGAATNGAGPKKRKAAVETADEDEGGMTKAKKAKGGRVKTTDGFTAVNDGRSEGSEDEETSDPGAGVKAEMEDD